MRIYLHTCMLAKVWTSAKIICQSEDNASSAQPTDRRNANTDLARSIRESLCVLTLTKPENKQQNKWERERERWQKKTKTTKTEGCVLWLDKAVCVDFIYWHSKHLSVRMNLCLVSHKFSFIQVELDETKTNFVLMYFILSWSMNHSNTNYMQSIIKTPNKTSLNSLVFHNLFNIKLIWSLSLFICMKIFANNNLTIERKKRNEICWMKWERGVRTQALG